MSWEMFRIFDSSIASIAIWLFITIVLLYLARTPAHHAVRSLARVIHSAMRLSARSVLRAEQKLAARNKEVLLAAGRETAERIVEREFDRIDASVRRDLAEYPALHRKLSEIIERIDADYKESTDVPPAPPAWIKAIDAVAKIPASKGDPTVAGVLEDIHISMQKANTNALEEYRKSSHTRHRLLNKMMPHWRKLLRTLESVNKNVSSLLERSKVIDRHMDEYENVMQRTERAVRQLSSSSLTNFFTSTLVMVIVIGAAMVNFSLIALPLSEMVDAKSELFGFATPDVAALFIILIELAMGLFLMESLRITRLFPVIGALDDKLRVRMIWFFFAMLLAMACVEAGLAFMRDWMAQSRAVTDAYVIGQQSAVGAESAFRWITTAAQMGLGFVLPFVLASAAIPLETFVHSLRTMLGVIGVAFLRALAWFLRLLGTLGRRLGDTLIQVYDLVIFGPLWLERMIKSHTGTPEKKEDKYDADSISV
ncbi:MAG: hypothetical protein JSW10_04715 [Pseudomonadota bacterium]|nr:MAG: hypothetical protein JSW10_04715 [Pseudomonadota bacterium]